jgi:N-acylneuraminate cytidylyltransferase
MRIAVIPARGGSKRIPRKNIKLFHGKPMIAWSIEAALNSACFDRVIVSTDDEEIAAISVQYGADAPFIRPKNLSDDFTGTIPVINHAITWLRESGFDVDNVCCIYATAPFILPEDLQRGLKALKETNASYAFAVTSYAFPIQRALRRTDGGRVEMLYPENFSVRSQDLEEAWHDAGQFYWGKASAWLSEEPLFSEVSVPILLPRHRVQDIDTPEDWVRAEWLFDAWRSS